MTNKWLTLEASTIIYHCYNLDEELGFSMNTLTRVIKLFGGTSAMNSKVSGGNSTGVHLHTHGFVKYEKNENNFEAN